MFSLRFYCLFFVTSLNKVSVIHCSLFTTSSILRNWIAIALERRVPSICILLLLVWAVVVVIGFSKQSSHVLVVKSCELYWNRIYGIVFIFHHFFFFLFFLMPHGPPYPNHSFISHVLWLRKHSWYVFSQGMDCCQSYFLYTYVCTNRWHCSLKII